MNINTATISSNFPNTAEEFWSVRPVDLSPWSWLFHPLNPWHLEPTLVAKILNRIEHYSSRSGWTCFFQKTLAYWLGISERWLREILRRLKLIGWIEDRKVRKSRQYRIAPSLPFIRSGETSGESSFISTASDTSIEACASPSPSYMQHQDPCSKSVDTIITTSDDVKADPIVQTFEESTGTRYRSDRDHTTLQELRQYDPLAVEAGILETALNATTTINSMRYCLPQIKLFVCALQGTRQRPPLSRETLRVIIKARRIRLQRIRAGLITRDQLTIERTEEQRREMQWQITH